MRSILFMSAILLVAVMLLQERMQELPSAVADSYVETQQSDWQGRSVPVAPETRHHQQGGAELQTANAERQDTSFDNNVRNELALPRGPGGHYFLTAQVNGVDMTFLVDTGATDVALGAEHAEKLRLQLQDKDYTKRYRTANGIVRGAPVALRQVQAGRLRLRDVEASVLDGPLDMPLLGMSFLNRLKGYEVRGDQLVLRF